MTKQLDMSKKFDAQETELQKFKRYNRLEKFCGKSTNYLDKENLHQKYSGTVRKGTIAILAHSVHKGTVA